jgi:hypothetical protein
MTGCSARWLRSSQQQGHTDNVTSGCSSSGLEVASEFASAWPAATSSAGRLQRQAPQELTAEDHIEDATSCGSSSAFRLVAAAAAAQWVAGGLGASGWTMQQQRHTERSSSSNTIDWQAAAAGGTGADCSMATMRAAAAAIAAAAAAAAGARVALMAARPHVVQQQQQQHVSLQRQVVQEVTAARLHQLHCGQQLLLLLQHVGSASGTGAHSSLLPRACISSIVAMHVHAQQQSDCNDCSAGSAMFLNTRGRYKQWQNKVPCQAAATGHTGAHSITATAAIAIVWLWLVAGTDRVPCSSGLRPSWQSLLLLAVCCCPCCKGYM